MIGEFYLHPSCQTFPVIKHCGVKRPRPYFALCGQSLRKMILIGDHLQRCAKMVERPELADGRPVCLCSGRARSIFDRYADGAAPGVVTQLTTCFRQAPALFKQSFWASRFYGGQLHSACWGGSGPIRIPPKDFQEVSVSKCASIWVPVHVTMAWYRSVLMGVTAA